MMLTSRDNDILNLLDEFEVCPTTTLRHLFFPSLSACQKRMKTLYENKRVKRLRLTLNHDYLYYLNLPKQYMHRYLIMEFYGRLLKETEVIHYNVQKKLGKIIPDSYFLCKLNGKEYLGFLELERSNNGVDYEKYEEFYRTKAYREWFPTMPTVYIMGRKFKVPKNTNVKYVVLKNDLSNFRLY